MSRPWREFWIGLIAISLSAVGLYFFAAWQIEKRPPFVAYHQKDDV